MTSAPITSRLLPTCVSINHLTTSKRRSSLSNSAIPASRGHQAFDRHDGVHAARAKAVQIEGHILEAKLVQPTCDRLAGSDSRQPWEFLNRHFDPSQVSHFMSNAELAESKFATQVLFGFVHAANPLGRDS